MTIDQTTLEAVIAQRQTIRALIDQEDEEDNRSRISSRV